MLQHSHSLTFTRLFSTSHRQNSLDFFMISLFFHIWPIVSVAVLVFIIDFCFLCNQFSHARAPHLFVPKVPIFLVPLFSVYFKNGILTYVLALSYKSHYSHEIGSFWLSETSKALRSAYVSLGLILCVCVLHLHTSILKKAIKIQIVDNFVA